MKLKEAKDSQQGWRSVYWSVSCSQAVSVFSLTYFSAEAKTHFLHCTDMLPTLHNLFAFLASLLNKQFVNTVSRLCFVKTHRAPHISLVSSDAWEGATFLLSTSLLPPTETSMSPCLCGGDQGRSHSITHMTHLLPSMSMHWLQRSSPPGPAPFPSNQ